MVCSNLGERDGVDAVLASDLKSNSVAGLGVPGSLGTSLNLAVDLVVVRSSEHAQVIGSGDGSAVERGYVSNGSAVAGQGSPVDIVTGAGTSQETLVADNGINISGGALEKVEEGSAMEAGLLEVGVELGTLCSGSREEVEETLKLEAFGNGVGGLDLGVKRVGGGPCLGKGETWTAVEH